MQRCIARYCVPLSTKQPSSRMRSIFNAMSRGFIHSLVNLNLAPSIAQLYNSATIIIDRESYSFIHTEHLYSASSRELLKGAPDSSTAKKSSLKLRKNEGDKALGKIRS